MRGLSIEGADALKGHVYSNDPQTVGALERSIRAAIRAIGLTTLNRVFQNFLSVV